MSNSDKIVESLYKTVHGAVGVILFLLIVGLLLLNHNQHAAYYFMGLATGGLMFTFVLMLKLVGGDAPEEVEEDNRARDDPGYIGPVIVDR